ncbi:MAG: hypothetical protein RIQ89_645 [Bacteroidota bacterium]|jgi:UDP-N-acetylmuramyl pentapeptide phosphotransferase/UDP-N-acetylglucosamine-1-phosphate transferase
MELGFYFLLTFASAYFIARLCIPFIIQMASKHNLLDKPDERKQHKNPIPAFGGIAIFLGFTVTSIFWLGTLSGPESRFLFPALIILFGTGICDDIQPISPKVKFLFQFIAAFIVCYGGFRITNLYGFLNIYEINIVTQYALTMVFIAGFTNAFNLIDGVDGLAGGIGFIISLAFAILFYNTSLYFYFALCLALCGALLGFLVFNFSPARIFMGDTGSLTLGFILVVLGIKFLSLADHFILGVELKNPLVVLASMLFIPIFDTLRVFAIRIYKGKSPFSADRRHIHHRLLRNNLNHKTVSLIIYTVTVQFILLGLYLQSLGTSRSIIFLFMCSILLTEVITIFFIYQSRRKMKGVINQLREHNRSNQFAKRILKP